jgi:hypothetical protein
VALDKSEGIVKGTIVLVGAMSTADSPFSPIWAKSCQAPLGIESLLSHSFQSRNKISKMAG